MNMYRVGDATVLNDQLAVPGIGHLPINAFVLHAREPLVVDTGLSLADRDFVADLGSVIDPADVRWIWLTHPDRDHTGGLFALLEAAPQAKVVTTFLGVGIMSTDRPLPLDRVHLLNHGQRLDVGDRTLIGFRPPLFDNPATVGFYDDKSRICFTSDCLGGPMPSADLASCPDVRQLAAAELLHAQLLWAAVDSPWVHNVNAQAYADTVRAMQAFDSDIFLSTHLPPAVGIGDQLVAMMRAAPDASPFIGPDQAALEHMLAGFEVAPVA
jgi:hypothetical protein